MIRSRTGYFGHCDLDNYLGVRPADRDPGRNQTICHATMRRIASRVDFSETPMHRITLTRVEQVKASSTVLSN